MRSCAVARAKASADMISRLSLEGIYIFVAKVDVGRFIEPCWIEMQLMEGERPLQRSRRPREAK